MNNISRMKSNFFKGNLIKVLLHLLAWTIIVGLPLYFIERWQMGKDFIWLYYIKTLISVIIFYVNYIFLVPKFFFDRKKYRYYLSVLVLIACFYFVSDISNKLVFKYESGSAQPEQIDRQPRGPGRILPPGPPFSGMHLYSYGFASLFFIFLALD